MRPDPDNSIFHARGAFAERQQGGRPGRIRRRELLHTLQPDPGNAGVGKANMGKKG